MNLYQHPLSEVDDKGILNEWAIASQIVDGLFLKSFPKNRMHYKSIAVKAIVRRGYSVREGLKLLKAISEKELWAIRVVQNAIAYSIQESQVNLNEYQDR